MYRHCVPYIRGMKKSDIGGEDLKCESCVLGRSMRAPRNLTEGQGFGARKPLEQVYIYVVGRMKLRH